jgi:hypothetical protein
MSSLGFTSKEQRNLGLLVHLMTSNPKILYAPAGSEADRVILKVCKSAHLVPELCVFQAGTHKQGLTDCSAGLCLRRGVG